MNEKDLEKMTKEAPQLIMALESSPESTKYVSIEEVTEGTKYYCPCCHGEIAPRAYKKDKKYLVQPHFYHLNDGCSEETYLHYICKEFLIENNCKFIVNGVEYEVESFEVEKTWNTSYGKYRPDITVFTTEGKTFYFEIMVTNKKDDSYIMKWDELGNDVVEVNAKEIVNHKIQNIIPEFKLIYSEGQCFIKSYIHKDYEEYISKKKLELKRQDKIDYKIYWEQLDWFWMKTCEFNKGLCDLDSLLIAFDKVDVSIIEVCWLLISKMNCMKECKSRFRDIVNKKSNELFVKQIKNMKDKYSRHIDIRLDRPTFFTPKTGMNIGNNHCNLSYDTRKWIIYPSEVYEFIEQSDKKLNIEFKKRETLFLIKEYITEDKFPLWFRDVLIKWDGFNVPHLTNIPSLTSFLGTDNFCEIQENIKLCYDDCLKKCQDQGVDNYIIVYILDIIEKMFYDKNVKTERMFRDNKISILFIKNKLLDITCGSKFITIKMNGEEEKISFIGKEIKDVCNYVIEVCMKKIESTSSSFADMVNDILMGSKCSYCWNISCDYSTYEISFIFTYYYNYLNDYRKENKIYGSCNLNEVVNTSSVITISNHHELSSIVKTHLAKTMKDMLLKEKQCFELIHESYGICIVDRGGNIIE